MTGLSRSQLADKYDDLADNIRSTFCWTSTKAGHDFWANMVEWLELKADSFRAPIKVKPKLRIVS